ncbi:inorganic pyrophosphatase [Cokeromyces recurvatus]|uniref:inorganic pyrophosphatase n=1 Tax=Cokeromyces recurvatus TaxID=90255 RepID=UPI0022206B31|nr:inorganic pyrophosphatase [Cokeromyces recurvatus]KAI7899458.1 inorganic pyrophosphatase [Cokeromyces recurvatus]
MKLFSLFSLLIFGYFIPTSLASDDISLRTIGAPNTLDYKVYFEKNGTIISPFHDVPLFADKEKSLYNMIVEMPRWTTAKNEINKETPLNPIMQDVSDGKLRFVHNLFPFKGYIWNYGAFPQTWEDPRYISPYTNSKGDNDPIDVVELGQNVATVGEIKQVKILGIIGLLDQNETDWKVVVIDHEDPLAEKLNDINDVETYMPGYLNATNFFLINYKLPGGKKKNEIAFNSTAQPKEFATHIVLETHELWKALVNGTTTEDEIQTINTSVDGSPYKTTPDNYTIASIPQNNTLPAAPIMKENDIWYFIDTLQNRTEEN